MGLRSLPVTVIVDKAIAGFSPNEIMEALQRGTKVTPRGSPETIGLIGHALEAVERAVRQMPDDRLDWSLPQRKRSMRDFTHHIFSHVLSIVKEQSIRKIENVEAKADYASFQIIADYGGAIGEMFRDWVAQQDLDALSKSESSVSNVAERLDLVAGQIIHHLRQLYYILECFGIIPENRIDDSEWPSEYVLTDLC